MTTGLTRGASAFAVPEAHSAGRGGSDSVAGRNSVPLVGSLSSGLMPNVSAPQHTSLLLWVGGSFAEPSH